MLFGPAQTLPEPDCWREYSYGGFGEDARTSASMPLAGHPNPTSPLPTPVDFQRDSRDFRPLPGGLRAGFT